MDVYVSKRLFIVILLLILAGIMADLALPRLTGRSLAQVAGFDSGRAAAIAGVEAFYSVDYTESSDVWAARLCALSSEPACDFYQNTIMPYVWPEIVSTQTTVIAATDQVVKLADEVADTRDAEPMQVWRMNVSLSQPWPQGNGQTEFPAYVLVVREKNGWKFERFLLNDELVRYTGGEK